MTRAARRIVLGLLVAAAGCGDPVHTDEVDALGPEDPGVPAGPLHRPGQPCLVCHDGTGPGNVVLSVAGTVYEQAETAVPARDVLVEIVDAHEKRYTAATNCAGNFLVREADYDPVYPVRVSVRYADLLTKMRTQVFRDGSCSRCHTDPPGLRSAGHVYVAPHPFDFPPGGCP